MRNNIESTHVVNSKFTWTALNRRTKVALLARIFYIVL